VRAARGDEGQRCLDRQGEGRQGQSETIAPIRVRAEHAAPHPDVKGTRWRLNGRDASAASGRLVRADVSSRLTSRHDSINRRRHKRLREIEKISGIGLPVTA
jgi:hypothetical protein